MIAASILTNDKTPSNIEETSGSNNSLMVRGAVLQDISETTVSLCIISLVLIAM